MPELTATPDMQAVKRPSAEDNHIKAARCHEMAAALHHEAARFYADGDAENAEECAKQARTHAARAMELTAGCGAAVSTH